MPHKKIIRSSEFPYHVSARSNNKEWFGLEPDLLWTIFEDYLFLVSKLFNLEIHAFVLMSNHFHLLLKTPEANIDEAMRYFMRETSRVMAFELRRINHIYGGSYRWSLITTHNYYLNAYKYIYRNPVEAKICSKVEEYSYSTLQGLLGSRHMIIPIVGNHELLEQSYEFLEWLNTSYKNDEKEMIRKALRKREFKLSVSQKTKKPVNLDSPTFGPPQY